MSPTRPIWRELGWFDTLASHNLAIFDGIWGVFPFYPNSPGVFVCSDINRGLFVMELDSSILLRGSRGPRGMASRTETAPARLDNVVLGHASPNPVRAGRETVVHFVAPRGAMVSAPGR